MKFLILTNPKHEEFIFETTRPFMDESFIMIYKGEDEIDNWDELNGIGYDIGISFMYQYKVPKEQLTKTWFNFHPAPLPEYKGRNLCYHAIMNGAKSFGATVHYMDENFDTGGIIEAFDFPIDPSWTAQDLHDKVMEESRRLFKRFFPMIIQGYNFGYTHNEGGRYYKKEPIEDYIGLNDYQDRRVRAITYGDFYPKIDIGGVAYKIVRDE